MESRLKKEQVDYLIDYLWQHGYLTLSRKYGKYLPVPPLIGVYEVDVIAKYKNKIAIGYTVSTDEFKDHSFLNRLDFLTHCRIRFPQNKISIFLGVPYNLLIKASLIITSLSEEAKKQIKVIALPNSIL